MWDIFLSEFFLVETHLQEVSLWLLFWLLELTSIAIVFIPIKRFLNSGWEVRKQEFMNRLASKDISPYISRYWQMSLRDVNLGPNKSEERIMDYVYDIIIGKALFNAPLILLCMLIALFAGFVISTAFRFGYEQYIIDYVKWMNQEDKLAPADLHHLAIATMDAILLPFSLLTMTVSVMAAVSGAYLYTAQIAIQGYRARTLVSSDLWGCCARMMISIPLGLSLSLVASDTIGPFISFAIGAFPTDAVLKSLRQLVGQYTKSSADANDTDNLVSMLGVTQRVAINLSGEGIDSVQQLADVDPVSLALRTGLSFDYILNLVSQSQAWSFIGSTAAALAPLGLGDARIISKLMDGVDNGDPNAVATLNQAAKRAGIDAAALEFSFKNIASDSYTKFLTQF